MLRYIENGHIAENTSAYQANTERPGITIGYGIMNDHGGDGDGDGDGDVIILQV
jgi:hypothetical protein